MKIELVNADVLTVGPDEVLVIRMPDMRDLPDGDQIIKDFVNHLEAVGLKGRSVVFVGEVELTKVAR